MQVFQQPTAPNERVIQVFFGLLAYQFNQYCSWTLGSMNQSQIEVPAVLWLPFFKDSLDIANFFFIGSVVALAVSVALPRWSVAHWVTALFVSVSCAIDFMWRGLWQSFIVVAAASILIAIFTQFRHRLPESRIFNIYFWIQLFVIAAMVSGVSYSLRAEATLPVEIYLYGKCLALFVLLILSVMPQKNWLNGGWIFCLVMISDYFILDRVDPFLFGPIVAIWFYGYLKGLPEFLNWRKAHAA